MRKKAVILVSGGVDSTTVLAIAKDMGYELYPISFRYGQKHVVELEKAKQAVLNLGISNHKIINLDLRSFGGSALTDEHIDVPKYNNAEELGDDIPVTYVPARNTVFLSLALAYAEVVGAYDIFIGVHAQDYSNYPDCRPEFIESFEKLANKAVSFNVHDEIRIQAPLINMTKAEIIAKGISLGVDYSHTISCYDPTEDGKSCGNCHACLLRKDGFKMNGVEDPTIYR